jgi:predicted transcriptional regulator of viral defense system
MVNTDALKQFGIIPVDIVTLKAALDGYKSTNDKIASLEHSGFVIRLKRGVFVVSPKVHHKPLSKELIANHLYGTSYISLHTALSFYGLIPERVTTVCSVSTKRSHSIQNSVGNFDFVAAKLPYFSIGVRQEIVNNEYAFLIATPEKALCDIIVQTKGIKLQSVKAMRNFIENDMRIDLSVFEHYNIEIVKECINVSTKKRELTLLYKLLEE